MTNPLIKIIRAQRAVKRAAEILEYEAESLKDCHAINGNWSGEPAAKQDYDEYKKVAKELRYMIVGAPTLKLEGE